MTAAIQPCGNKASREHYRDTIESPVDLDEKRELLGSAYESLGSLFPDHRAALWGVTPGKNNANGSKYAKLDDGDVVVFTRDKRVIASGIIAYRFRNAELARDLWGVDASGQTWELMYALRDVQERNIPYPLLRGAIGSRDGDNFMGFRVLSRAKSEGLLELLDMEIPPAPWDISPGEELRRTELQRRYGGGPFGGIEPSAQSANIFLFTNPYKKSAYGYNYDGQREDGSFAYTGDGQVGNQSPEEGGNKQLLDYRRERRALRLFEVTKKTTVVRYIGEYELGSPEYVVERAPDLNGDEREVLVFNLVPIGVSTSAGGDDAQPRFGGVSRRESEHGASLSHERHIAITHTTAKRRELQLQERYKEFLKRGGADVESLEITVPGIGAKLIPDLANFTDSEIIEVKFGVTRSYVREAIGQVLDYVFQIREIDGAVWSPAILLPGKPSNDLIGLVRSLGIRLVWETASGSFEWSESG